MSRQIAQVAILVTDELPLLAIAEATPEKIDSCLGAGSRLPQNKVMSKAALLFGHLEFPAAWLGPGETYRHEMRFEFS